MGRKTTVLAATAAGAAVAYFLDPAMGRTRRAKATDQLAAAFRRPARTLQDQAAKKAKVARDRAGGVAHELTTADTPPPSDQALVDKIRSEVLGGNEWSRYTLNVDATDGAVALRGQVDRPDQVRELERAVAGVPGVRRVDNFVHPPGTEPENIQSAVDASRRGGSD